MFKLRSSKFSAIQYWYFCFNWIVGFGFIAAMSSVISTGSWSILSFVVAAFLTLSVMLVFSRGANLYPDEKGGIYGYSKLVFGRWGRFFYGWNQLQQIFLMSAASPLFLISLLKLVNDNPQYDILYYCLTLGLYIIMAILGIFGLKISKVAIFIFAGLKWLTIMGAVILIVYLGFRDRAWERTIQGKAGTEISVSIIMSNIIFFSFAFAGFDSLSAATVDVAKSNLRKGLMSVYMTILAFYFLVFIVFLGIERAYDIGGFQGIWKTVFGLIGIIIFIFGSVCSQFTSTVSVIYFYSRIIVPLAEDGYLPSFLKRKNRFGEYANAMYTALIIILLSMLFFTILPKLIGAENAFSKVIETGMIIFMNNYIGGFIVFFILSYRKKIVIPLWEKVIYLLGALTAMTILVFNSFPFVVGEPWTIANTLMVCSYFVTLLLGYIIWYINHLFQKGKGKVLSKKDDIKFLKKTKKVWKYFI